MTATSAANPAHGFAPLAPLLRSVSPEKLDEARQRIAKLDRDDLIQRYRTAFSNSKRTSSAGSRVLSFLLSEELTRRRIAPWLRHHHLSATDYSINQAFDLMIYDIRYVRRAFPEHARVVKYRRCRALFLDPESTFHAEAVYCFYGGIRAAWKIVKSLSLSEEQQLGCMWLRSVPIARRLDATQAMRDQVFQLLQADLQATRRTKAFTDEDARAALRRRHALWLCRAHTTGSAAEIAKTYEAMTGQEISRQVVFRQLQLVDEVIKRGRVKMSSE